MQQPFVIKENGCVILLCLPAGNSPYQPVRQPGRLQVYDPESLVVVLVNNLVNVNGFVDGIIEGSFRSSLSGST